MGTQPSTSETHSFCVSTMLGSDDSDEETSQDDQPITSWNDLSIIERVGLNSLEMSEKDIEVAFCQITLAFRCDQYTLKQRLQAEEHARNLAEENVQLELARGKETLEMLKALCLDSRRSTILQKLELSLDILSGTVGRISNTAEVLGAVHQEARVSRAVELMVAHVQNLRKRYEKNLSELEEARRQIQLRTVQINNRDSPDSEETGNNRRLIKQNSLRRRISASIITNQSNEKKKKESRKRSSKKSSSPCHSSESSFCVLNDTCCSDDRVVDSPTDPAESFLDPPSEPKKEVSSTAKAPSKNSTYESLRQRHRGRANVSRKKTDRKSLLVNQRTLTARSGSFFKNRWALLSLYLFLFFCIITVTYYILQSEESE